MKKLILSLVLACSSYAASCADKIEVSKRESAEYRETYYTVSSDSCDIAWTMRRFADNTAFGVSEQSKCSLPLKNQIPYRQALLRRLMTDTNDLEGMRNFVWGRLQRGDANDEYSIRLATAASKSKHWDQRKGTTVNYRKGVNRFVEELLSRENVFAELVTTFASQNVKLSVNDVEKVLINTVRLNDSNISKNGKLPVDCIVSFSVAKR